MQKHEQRTTLGDTVTVGPAVIEEEGEAIEGSCNPPYERETIEVSVPTAETVPIRLCNLTCVEQGVKWMCCEDEERQYPPAESVVSAKEEDKKQYQKELERYKTVREVHRLFQILVHWLT